MRTRNMRTPEVKGLVLKVKRLYPDARIPTKATPESACYDVYAHGTYDVYSHLVCTPPLIGTGCAFEIPKGYHIEVNIRSGVSHKTFLRLANGTGIVDSDYTGELMLIVDNIGRGVYTVHDGDRIGQIRLVKDEEYKMEEVDDVKQGTHAGFGSTGR